MKYPSKSAFVADAVKEWTELWRQVDAVGRDLRSEPGACGQWSVKDVLAHLHEWHLLALGWHEAGLRGQSAPMPAAGYKWSQLAALNDELFQRNRLAALDVVEADLRGSHQVVLDLVAGLSDEQLLLPGHFTWTKTSPLSTYLHPCTSGHYRWATGLIKKWRKSGGV